MPSNPDPVDFSLLGLLEQPLDNFCNAVAAAAAAKGRDVAAGVRLIISLLWQEGEQGRQPAASERAGVNGLQQTTPFLRTALPSRLSLSSSWGLTFPWFRRQLRLAELQERLEDQSRAYRLNSGRGTTERA